MQLKSMYVVRIINRIVENGLLVREVFYYARNIGVCTVGSDIYIIKCKDARVANENVAGLRRRQGGVMIQVRLHLDRSLGETQHPRKQDCSNDISR